MTLQVATHGHNAVSPPTPAMGLGRCEWLVEHTTWRHKFLVIGDPKALSAPASPPHSVRWAATAATPDTEGGHKGWHRSSLGASGGIRGCLG